MIQSMGIRSLNVFYLIIKQSNPRNEISMISFVCFETGGQVSTLEVFFPFTKVCAICMYYGAYKLLIADVKCIMRTSFLQSFVSLGDQGDPTEPLIQKDTFNGTLSNAVSCR